MARSYWIAPKEPLHIADGTALASSTTLTDISPGGTTNAVTFAPNELVLGQRLEFYAFGRYSTTGTPTLLIGVYIGGVAGAALCATSALTTVSGVTNRSWRLEGHAQVRAVGSSGSVLGIAEVSNITTNGTDLAPATAPTAATWDTTASKIFTVGAQWGTSSASNTVTCHYFGVRVVA